MTTNNKDFTKFLRLKAKYEKESNEMKKKALKVDVADEVIRLITEGYATQSLKIVYDLGIEKYRTIGLEDMAIKIYDKDKSVKGIMRKTYSIFLPKNATDLIPYKELIFDPFKPLSFSRSGIDYANLFIPSKFYSIIPKQNEMIDYIDWDKYPNIKALFENVFKTIDRMNYFVNWLAYGFQTKKKCRTAIVSVGIQGTGKGVIFDEIINYAIGERYITVIDNEALKSKFNGDLENKLFILANEIKADFREGNTVYERLKMYVADSIIRFEEKNIKARKMPNFFNIWFHSNNAIPLQIQGSDRRYTVFNTKSRKLTEVSEELGFTHIRFYIDKIRDERDNFIIDLMRIKYDIALATTPLNTLEKEIIQESSVSKIEVMSDKIKSFDVEYFRDILEGFYSDEDSNNDSFSDIKLFLSKDLKIFNSEVFLIELQKQFKGNYLQSNLFSVLYKILVNPKENATKIGRDLNKYFEKTQRTTIDGKTRRYRRINRDKECYINAFPIQHEDANGNIIKTEMSGPISQPDIFNQGSKEQIF